MFWGWNKSRVGDWWLEDQDGLSFEFKKMFQQVNQGWYMSGQVFALDNDMLEQPLKDGEG